MEDECGAIICQMPTEILCKIGLLVDLIDVINMMNTCGIMKMALDDKFIWNELYRQHICDMPKNNRFFNSKKQLLDFITTKKRMKMAVVDILKIPVGCYDDDIVHLAMFGSAVRSMCSPTDEPIGDIDLWCSSTNPRKILKTVIRHVTSILGYYNINNICVKRHSGYQFASIHYRLTCATIGDRALYIDLIVGELDKNRWDFCVNSLMYSYIKDQWVLQHRLPNTNVMMLTQIIDNIRNKIAYANTEFISTHFQNRLRARGAKLQQLGYRVCYNDDKSPIALRQDGDMLKIKM